MTAELGRLEHKWRPSVRLILLVLNLTVLMLPLAGFVFLRIYENQLVHETEGELIAQAAVLSAVMTSAVRRTHPDGIATYGRPVETQPGAGRDAFYTPVAPVVDLARDTILPRRPDAELPDQPPDAAAVAIGTDVSRMFESAQRVTLAGLRVLDAHGVVIGGRGEIGLTLARLPEVQTAMSGRYAGVVRQRQPNSPQPAITSISRGALVRLFIAYPVVDAGRLLGVLYLSRTPDNVWRRLYDVRHRLLVASIGVLAITVLLAMVTSRTILGPVDALNRQAEQIAAGRLATVQPLAHAGTREIARLAGSIADMARALSQRARYINDFAMHVSHAFKTPLTAIEGAAELLLEHPADMSDDDRRRFLANIRSDADRMRRLVSRLNDLARADAMVDSGAITDVTPALEAFVRETASIDIALAVSGPANAHVRLPSDAVAIVADNLIANAAAAGATRVAITVHIAADTVIISFVDNGDGIAPGNRDKVFEPFFTTRATDGGTGLGLRIVASLVESHGGTIRLDAAARATTFVVSLPLVVSHPRRP